MNKKAHHAMHMVLRAVFVLFLTSAIPQQCVASNSDEAATGSSLRGRTDRQLQSLRQALQEGIWYNIIPRHSLNRFIGRSLSADRDDPDEVGSRVTQYTVNYTSTLDDWRVVKFDYPNSPNCYQFINRHSGLALNVAGNNDNKGANLIQWRTNNNGARNDIFCLADADNDGWYEIVAQHSQQVVDVKGESWLDGAPIVQYPSNGGFNQQFKFVPDMGKCAKIQTDRDYRIVARHSGKSIHNGDGGFVVQNPYDSQQEDDIWQLAIAFTAAGFGYTDEAYGFDTFYRIRHVASVDYLKQMTLLPGERINAGFEVQDTDNLWCFQEASDGYYTILSRASGLHLDISEASTEDSATLIQWMPNGGTNQEFELLPLDSCPGFPNRNSYTCLSNELECSYSSTGISDEGYVCDFTDSCACGSSGWQCTTTSSGCKTPSSQCPSKADLLSQSTCSFLDCSYLSFEVNTTTTCRIWESCSCGDPTAVCEITSKSCVPLPTDDCKENEAISAEKTEGVGVCFHEGWEDHTCEYVLSETESCTTFRICECNSQSSSLLCIGVRTECD